MNLYKFLVTALLLFFLLLSSSCKEEGIDVPDKFDRVVIVYLAGDNNLSSEVDIKIAALRYGLKNIDTYANRVVVYADYVDAMPRIIELNLEEDRVVRSYAALNSADPVIMNGVLTDIMRLYPADSYGLIVFSHATGWLPPGVYGQDYSDLKECERSTRSIFVDGNEEMSIVDFANHLPVPPQGKYAFVIFEACLMSGIEVAYELREATDYIVASSTEILSPGFIDCYSSSLVSLFLKEPDLKQFCQKYYALYSAESGPRQSATISLIRTAGLERLTATVADVLNAPLNVADLGSIQHFDRTSQHAFYDLSDYLEAVSTLPLAAYYEALDNTVVYAAATPYFMNGYPYSFPIKSHSGLTVYVRDDRFDVLNTAYEDLDFFGRINNN